MQLKALVLASVLATLAAATPTRRTGGGGGGTTPPTTPSDQCCNTVTTAGDESASKIIALLGINVSDLNVPVGLNCVPITVVGGGAAGCNEQPVTCEDNSHGGLIAIGCIPITFRREATLARRTGGGGGTTPPPTTTPSDQCCNTVTTAGSDSASKIIALLGINVSDLNVPVGLNCVPITVVGGGAAGCNEQPVTCEDNSHGGLIAIGCVPISFRRNDTPPPTTTPSDQCCETVTTAGSDSASKIIGLLGINVSDVNVPVGLNCVPITVVGGGAAGCNNQPVTCDSSEASWHGLIAIGCVPITFNKRTGGGGGTTPPPTTTPSDQCCETTTTAGSDSASKLIALLGINVSDLNVPVGLNCVPITVIGGGAAGCNNQPVTCDSSNWGGLIAIGCVPITF